MMKPVQFFGVLPVCPSEKLAMRGAVVQFIIPGLKISGEELNSFQKIAVACGDGVESAHFKRVHSDPDKHPATLVSIAFHVSDGAESEESAHTTGRLIAERFPDRNADELLRDRPLLLAILAFGALAAGVLMA